ncbi:MAG: hypothetical protein ACM3JG_10155 [Thiohalocapsa sp.]
MAPRSALGIGFGLAAALALAMPPNRVAAQQRHAAAAPANPLNRVHDRLLKMPPSERAATLARAIGHWCIGTEAFPMGIVTKGTGEGNAYWSLRCADGTAWAVQIDPMAEVTAIHCDDFKEASKEAGAARECFKKF